MYLRAGRVMGGARDIQRGRDVEMCDRRDKGKLEYLMGCRT